jgi:hypothetical protein
MPRPTAHRSRRLAVLTAVLATALLGLAPAQATAPAAPAASSLDATGTLRAASGAQVSKALFSNPVTPGAYTGLGFDQCLAPKQSDMDAWLKASPFRAVGIYISGASRGCRDQPNLTPTWISTQLAQGWRLLPITLGPQASCQPSFPRYGNDPTISPRTDASGAYAEAFAQGVNEANTAVAAAQALGIVPGSTLFYDLEGYDNTKTACRESALTFMSAWTQQLHNLGYVSGVYSSAGSGIKALDDARVLRPGAFAMPDQIWIARWDGVANTSTSYIRSDGWLPGRRLKQFQGGHKETWGGVTINIDRNYLDLAAIGPGTTPTTTPAPAPASYCGGTKVNFKNYPRVKSPTRSQKPSPARVSALKCLLKSQGVYKGKTKGAWSGRLTRSVKAWQGRVALRQTAMFSRSAWVSLLSAGGTPALNLGATGEDVRRVQRALNAANPKNRLKISGVYDNSTQAAVLAWQSKHGIGENGVVGAGSWAALQSGKK